LSSKKQTCVFCEKKIIGIHNSFIMGTVTRPDVKIKVFPENLVHDHKLQILKKLKKTDALILNLTEDIKGNVLKKPFPFITFQRISSSEQLPRDLKLDGDPWSDYFITLKSFKKERAATKNPSSSGKYFSFYYPRTGLALKIGAIYTRQVARQYGICWLKKNYP
jgi:hypothetical protein